jgi:hypothetical protein
VARFFIETSNGQVATHGQLLAAGLIADGADSPELPWHPVQGPPDASTMWFAVLRKRTRGIFIGNLVLRHGENHASLLGQGWEEVEHDQIGIDAAPPIPGEADEPAPAGRPDDQPM